MVARPLSLLHPKLHGWMDISVAAAMLAAAMLTVTYTKSVNMLVQIIALIM